MLDVDNLLRDSMHGDWSIIQSNDRQARALLRTLLELYGIFDENIKEFSVNKIKVKVP